MVITWAIRGNYMLKVRITINVLWIIMNYKVPKFL